MYASEFGLGKFHCIPTERKGGNLCKDVQHHVAVHICQVVPTAFLVIAEEMNCAHILTNRNTNEF